MAVEKLTVRSAEHDGYRPSRRIVFSGLASLGVAAALAGCGGNDSSTAREPGSDDLGNSGSGGSGSSAAAGSELAKTSEVPVGGGVILADDNIVITQPEAGTYAAFSATCTHQGFTVTSVANDVIECNHHGSEYSAADGSVKRGPAGAALKKVAIKVDGDSIVAA